VGVVGVVGRGDGVQRALATADDDRGQLVVTMRIGTVLHGSPPTRRSRPLGWCSRTARGRLFGNTETSTQSWRTARFWYYQNSATLTSMGEKRKPGRPATGRDPVRSIRIDDERWGKVTKAAEEDNTTNTEIVKRGIDEYLDKRDQQQK